MDSDQNSSTQQHGVPMGALNPQGVTSSTPQVIPSKNKENSSSGLSFSFHERNLFSGKKITSLLIGLIIVILMVGGIMALYSYFNREPKKVTLIYWGILEDPVTYQAVFSEFQKKYPHVKVKYEKQDITKLDKYIDRLTNRILGETQNESPDIFRLHNTWLPLTGKLLAPFPGDKVREIGLDDVYFDVVKKDLSRSGLFYAVPLEMDALSLFINEDILAESDVQAKPETWDEVIAAARRSVRYDESSFNDTIIRAGVGMGTYDNVEHASDIMSLLFIQNGVDMKDFLGPTREFAEGALGFYTAFADSGIEGRVWDQTLENSKQAFAQGKLAMYLGYARDIPDIRAQNPTLNMSIVKIPHVSGIEESLNKTIASYWAEGVSIKSEHKKEAFELLKFMSEKENLEKIHAEQTKQRVVGMPFARRDMLKRLENNQLLYPIASQGDKATSTLFASNTYDGSKIEELNSYLGNAIRSVNSGTSVESAIETLSQGVSSVYMTLGE